MQQARTFKVEHKGGKLRAGPKLKSWTHQDDLKALKGKEVTLVALDRTEIFGLLLEADQFTIKILETASQSVVTYFKHTLASFRAV